MTFAPNTYRKLVQTLLTMCLHITSNINIHINTQMHLMLKTITLFVYCVDCMYCNFFFVKET